MDAEGNEPVLKISFKITSLLSVLFLLSACGNAADESFNYAIYNQQASYSADQYQAMARDCSSTPNVTSSLSPSDDSSRFHACKVDSSAVTTSIKIFSADFKIYKKCVFPMKVSAAGITPIVLNSSLPVETRFLKLCGTIAGTGSSAVISNVEFNGLALVDSVNMGEFAACLADPTGNVESCMQGKGLNYSVGSI
jgi:hypothetical protein